MDLSPPTPELPVSDVAAAQRHYADVLGFQIAWHNTDGRIGAVAHGACAVFFRETDGPIHPQTLWIFAMDVDAAHDQLAAQGADIVGPLSNTPWGLRQFTVRDLNGHLIHFHHDL